MGKEEAEGGVNSLGQPSKRSRATFVALHPDILDNFMVWGALEWSGIVGYYRKQNESDEDLITRIKNAGSVTLKVSKYDPAHHFGPTMTIGSDDKALELTIPWCQVLAVTKGKTDELEIGFRPEGGNLAPKAAGKKK